MAGERLNSCLIAATGLHGDRRWALVDGTPNRAGKLLTNTQDARLMTYHARLENGQVAVTTPSGESRPLDDDLVADLAARTSRLLQLRDTAGFNFDDSPVLVVNLAAVAALELAAGAHLERRGVRAHLYLDRPQPEEGLRRLGPAVGGRDAGAGGIKRRRRCVGGNPPPG